jgi:hypothetical protein
VLLRDQERRAAAGNESGRDHGIGVGDVTSQKLLSSGLLVVGLGTRIASLRFGRLGHRLGLDETGTETLDLLLGRRTDVEAFHHCAESA